MRYPKRLIEVDLPIKKISEHARNEKNLRSGHPWHLHIWWARRPWGACRSVELASLLPDPVDSLCPPGFISEATDILSPLGYRPKSSSKEDLRKSLLRFIGDLADGSWVHQNFITLQRKVWFKRRIRKLPLLFLILLPVMALFRVRRFGWGVNQLLLI